MSIVMMVRSLALLVALCVGASAQGTALEQAQNYFRRTDYEDALELLADQTPKTAPMLQLMGRCYYLLGDFDKAVESFTAATGKDPGNSKYFDWLGRAWGRKAETSSFFTAPRYAVRARNAFEKAVSLDNKNTDAMEDLFEYYLQAPGFLGGGTDRAEALAERISAVDPVQGYWIQARLAEKNKQYNLAEQKLRLAVQSAPHQVGRVIDLAKFLARRGRYAESEEAFAHAQKVAPDDPKVLFEHAETLVNTKRDPQTAKKLLIQYIASPLTPDMPQRREAQALLEKAAGM